MLVVWKEHATMGVIWEALDPIRGKTIYNAGWERDAGCTNGQEAQRQW